MFYAFLAGLALAPLWFGGNRLVVWAANAILFPALVIVYEVRLLAGRLPYPFPPRRLWLPALCLGGVIAWGIVQTLPITPAVLHYPIWTLAADALGVPLDGSISVNRDLTILALLRMVTAAAVFWLALQLGSDPARGNRLLEGLAVIVTAYAAYGAIAFILDPTRMLWFRKIAYLDSATATFVNRNSFATYAGIGLVICLGLVLSVFRREMGAAPGSGARQRLAGFASAVSGRGGFFLVCAFISAAGLILSNSRAGVAAAIVGAVVLLVVASMRRTTSRAAAGVFGVIIFGVVAALLVFGDNLSDRLADTPELTFTSSDRGGVYAVTVQSILDQPWLGFGYGTFADAFPLYRSGDIGVMGIWDRAHNTYLEVMQGLGLPASLMLFTAVAVPLVFCLRGVLTRSYRVTPALIAIGATTVVLVHAVVDFSLQVQAVALTWTALLGIGVAQSYPRDASGPSRSEAARNARPNPVSVGKT